MVFGCLLRIFLPIGYESYQTVYGEERVARLHRRQLLRRVPVYVGWAIILVYVSGLQLDVPALLAFHVICFSYYFYLGMLIGQSIALERAERNLNRQPPG